MPSILTNDVPTRFYMVETGHGNEFFLNVEGALMLKEKLDHEYELRGLSKRTPMFTVKLDYSIYGNRNV